MNVASFIVSQGWTARKWLKNYRFLSLDSFNFCSSSFTAFMQELGHKTAFYHGSMDPHQRTHVQKQWSKDEINIICATVAFGMGIFLVYFSKHQI